MFAYDGYNHLLAHRIKPSVQRVAIMDYLMRHRTHPTADGIYSELSEKIPTLSRMTVYNTLKLLVEQGAVQQLSIDDKQAHYDADTTPHAHFRCNVCGMIYDVPIPPMSPTVAADFVVTETHLYYRGICKKCSQNDKE